MIAVDLTHVADHAIDEDGCLWQTTVTERPFQDQQDLLSASDGKGGDQGASSSRHHLGDLAHEAFFGRIAVFVQASSVGRLADHQIGLEIGTAQGGHGLLSRDAVIARVQHGPGRSLKQDHGGAQNVRRGQPTDLHLTHLNGLMVLDRHQRMQQMLDLNLRVQRNIRFAIRIVHQPQ